MKGSVSTKIKLFSLLVIFISSGFVFLNIGRAEDNFNPLNLSQIPGAVEGEGTHFEINDSQYLNIVLDSSEPIKIRMESVPEMITMMIESGSSISSTSTQITISSLSFLTTYYKYQDDYHNLTEFIADENGNYVYSQDLSKPHFVFIQPRASTKFIKDDATGGDCYLIGTWDNSTKTCTLTTDSSETIQIDNDGITLDGNNHTITGSNTGYGVYLAGRYNINAKNLNIKNFYSGIYLYYSNWNNLINNTISISSYTGIYLEHSNNNLINGVALNNNSIGIALVFGSNYNFLSNSTITNSSNVGVTFTTGSSGNTLKNSNVFNNRHGIRIVSASYNSFIGNVISGNQRGIGIIYWGVSNILESNTISRNVEGIYFYSDNGNNKVHNNNFVDNSTQIYADGGAINIFNLNKPAGGNYWSNFDESTEGCNDSNNDNFCDSPYVFTGGQDNLPWIKQDGWKIPANQPPTILNFGQFKSDGQIPISEGGITPEDMVVFKVNLQDPDNDQVKLQIELKEFNQSFTEQDLLESGFVASGSETVVSRQSLIDSQYHWRVKAVDSQGNASNWQEFGTAGNVDFEVKLPLAYKAANLAKLVINGPYLGDGDTFGGKGWDPNERLYVNSDKIFTGYNYWNNKLKKIAFGVGLDCSGLTQWAYNYSFDPKKSLTRNAIRYDGADGQYKNNTETEVLAEANLQPGDLLFLDRGNDNFIDHVAIYVGDNGDYDIVEAYSPRTGIVPANKVEFKTRIGFDQNKHIRRVIFNPSLGGQIKAGSPIDLVVIDPDGFTITPTTAIQTDNEYLREIPGELYYSEGELGLDGRPEDIVYWPKQKIGDYIIKVLPEADISPIENYNLEFQTGDQTITLAENMPLNQIPSEGYGVAVIEAGNIIPFIPVAIDIKPDSYPNSINLSSNGVVPVAIFGSDTFDVYQINLESITLTNALIKSKKNGQLMMNYEDVNEDGFMDVVVHIVTELLQLTSFDIKAELSGYLLDGKEIKGSDSIKIVP